MNLKLSPKKVDRPFMPQFTNNVLVCKDSLKIARIVSDHRGCRGR